MKLLNIRHRTRDSEVMDDFDLRGKELKKTLKDLDKVNKWLGGNKITIEGIKKVLREFPTSGVIRIIDVGCGNGTMLREVARFGRKNHLQMELTGIDANPHAIEIAREEAIDYPEIKFEALNIFSEEFAEKKCDIVLCTLTLHHFNEQEIESLMQLFVQMSGMGVVINDLQRSRLAFYLFQAFCAVFISNDIARDDGLTSIRRGFRQAELENHGSKLKLKTQKISWKWAFRYQWILIKSRS